ncbi:MAG: hypothetical protein CMB48_01750 [Euryarchaeota archaeon]|nr:hypothetical protein [Euryarchaeota archaeon]|tara:strand:- start:1521 stop:2123 length:603 start_codon:yes stop_codon:yes gene_type:complete
MKGTNSIFTLIFASLIVTSSMGCFGLVPLRESLELMRGAPAIENIEEKTNISYTFQTAQSEVYENSSTFEVTESVSELIIYVRVSMPDPLDLSQQVRELIYDTTGINVSTLSQEARYVHVKIKNPNGEIFYEKLASESIEPVVEVHRPPLTPGTWTLEVEARGYGFNIFEVVEAEDNFAAIITVTSECVKFTEEDCETED